MQLGRVLLGTAVLSAALVLGTSITTEDGSTQASGRFTFAEVPSSIPAGGANVNDVVVLMPPAATDRNTMHLSEALNAAQRLGLGRGMEATAVLAQFTVPGTIPPPDCPVPFRTIANRLAWVITFTSRRTENVSTIGRLRVRHFNVALDADTGEFLLGFYTK